MKHISDSKSRDIFSTKKTSSSFIKINFAF